MRLAPRELCGDDVAGRLAGVDRPGVDVQQRLAVRVALATAGESVIVAQQVHQVAGVARVEHRQRRRLAQGLGVGGHQTVGDRVECPAPQLARRVAPVADRRRPGQHLVGRAARERQQQDPLGLDAPVDEGRDPGDQRAGLAGPRARHHDQRTVTVRCGGQLRVVKSRIPTRVEHVSDDTGGRFGSGAATLRPARPGSSRARLNAHPEVPLVSSALVEVEVSERCRRHMGAGHGLAEANRPGGPPGWGGATASSTAARPGGSSHSRGPPHLARRASGQTHAAVALEPFCDHPFTQLRGDPSVASGITLRPAGPLWIERAG